jgi:hypothetical protein
MAVSIILILQTAAASIWHYSLRRKEAVFDTRIRFTTHAATNKPLEMDVSGGKKE